MREFQEFVQSELLELETRDPDQLFECLKDNLEEMGLELSETKENDLYEEIELQLNKDLI